MRAVRLLALGLAVLVLAGCQSDAEREADLERRVEERAAQSRELIDDLAARVGTSPEVRQDEVADCVPGQDDSGRQPTYTVGVTIHPDAVARLTGEIADDLAADGWTVKRDPVDPENKVVSVRFAKDVFTMGVRISEETKVATVGGSSECIR